MADQEGGLGWYTCVVTETGPDEGGGVNIRLTHQHPNHMFTDAWFGAVQPVRKEMLATALAAITAGWTVNAYLTDSVPYSICNRLYIRRP